MLLSGYIFTCNTYMVCTVCLLILITKKTEIWLKAQEKDG